MTRFAVAFLTVVALAGAKEGSRRMAELESALGLSYVQAETIEQAHWSLWENAGPILKDLRVLQRRLRAERHNESPDPTTVSMLEMQISSARQQLDILQVRAAAQARSVLTPIQIATLAAMREAEPMDRAAMTAVRYSLLDPPATFPKRDVGPRANQGDFRSDGSKR